MRAAVASTSRAPSDIVVLIHGLFGPFGDESIRSGLAPRTVLRPDLLGYGSLRGYVGDITIEAQVEYLAEVLLPAERVHLVGHSVGGVIAAVFADRFPEQVQSLTSVEGNVTLDDAFWSAGFARRTSDEAEALLAEYRADVASWWGTSSNANVDELAHRALDFQPTSTLLAVARSVVATTGDHRWPALLDRVVAQTPVHLVAGSYSRDGWHVTDRFLRSAASLTVIAGSGHSPMFDAPEAFVDALVRILPPLSLPEVRARIDAADREIVALLAQREVLVRRAATLKSNDQAVRAPERVAAVLARVRELAHTNGATPKTVERIYRGMIDAFIDLESAAR